MSLDLDAIAELEDIFDDRYVKKDVCDKTVKSEEEKIQKLEVKLTKVDTKLGILIGILSSICVPVVALCIKILLGG